MLPAKTSVVLVGIVNVNGDAVPLPPPTTLAVVLEVESPVNVCDSLRGTAAKK